MWKLISLALIQCTLLASGQVFLKLALQRIGTFGWTREFWLGLLANWPFAACGMCYAVGSVLWMYVLKNYPFSMAYPMVSFSYVIGMFAAILVFHENVPVQRWIGVLLIVGGCFMCASATAQTKVSPQEQTLMIQRIEKTAAQIKTLQCDFQQVKTLGMLNDKMKSQGKMYYRQGNQLRWEYVSPYKYTFILNGGKVLLKSSQKRDVIDVKSSKMFQEITRIMMNSVTGRCLSSKEDFVAVLQKTGKTWTAVLTPKKKQMKQMFKSIKLHISPEQNMVTQVELIEKSGDTTVITLQNAKKNQPINEQIFSVN